MLIDPWCVCVLSIALSLAGFTPEGSRHVIVGCIYGGVVRDGGTSLVACDFNVLPMLLRGGETTDAS